jgi:hypothetical protein
MKVLITAALLMAMHLFAFSQSASQVVAGEELAIGYLRKTFKMRDLQVSPVMYVANVNGLSISYSRNTPRNQWQANIQAGTAGFISPSLGIRAFQFSDQQESPLLLVPTLYTGGLTFTYRRLLKSKEALSSWAGVRLQETFYYADGLAMTTWAMNTLAMSINHHTHFRLANRHHLMADVTLPVFSAVSRMPYSNVVSRPELSNSKAFLKNTNWAGPLGYMQPQVEIAYRLLISKRVAAQAVYRYSWMRYPEPRLIRAASHTGEFSIIYQWHFQHN